MKSTALFILLSVVSVLSVVNSLEAQDKKPDKKEEPKVLMALPLGVPVEKPTKLTLRGLKLDTAIEVRWADPKVSAAIKILNKGKTGVPDKMEANRVGDTQVEVEVTLPAEAVSTAALIVRTPAGESNAHPLHVETELTIVAKKEPNGSFRQAQPVETPRMIEGTIGQGQDVDVFRVEGKASQKLSAVVMASRFGSMLDPILTVYDASGRQLALCDDADANGDARLEVMLPRDGVYFVSLIDAHDTGSNLHAYRLRLEAK